MMLCVVLCVITFISVANTLYVPVQCPQMCICPGNFTDCKYNNLSDLPNGLDPNVTILDLAHNNFRTFPEELNAYPMLTQLNLSHNQIEGLSDRAFTNLKNLQVLDLTHNMFVDWLDIRPGSLLKAQKLIFLDLSHNPLRSLPKDKNPLQMKALKILKMVNCSIEYLNAKIFITLPHLEELYLSLNPIKYLESRFNSSSLKLLDLSSCNLQHVGPTVFTSLTMLQIVYLSHNHDLKKFECDSLSLYYLDMADCNLESIPSGNMPNVRRANFHGNHFRTIPERCFQNFSKMEKLDLSYNAISNIDENTFVDLINVKTIDLSQNTLSTLSNYLFESNKNLKFLNLSRNFINNFQNFVSDTIEVLDLSSCEIPSLIQTSLTELPSLREFLLTNNPLSSLPDLWSSESLLRLDVSFCRIKTVTNRTFKNMPFLGEVNLAGNRLTSATPESFDQLSSVDISDNPWRCDCVDQRALYALLSRIGRNVDELYCQSPASLEGRPWYAACHREWYPETARGEMVWWYTTGLIVAVFALLLVVLILRRMHSLREKRAREAERMRRADERDALRRMQRMQAEVREETDRNAPDPRELQRPPSYVEALLMPKLDASHPSLAGSQHSLASKRSVHGSLQDVSRRPRHRRKRRRRRSASSDSRRASRTVLDSQDSSDSDRPHQALESDF